MADDNRTIMDKFFSHTYQTTHFDQQGQPGTESVLSALHNPNPKAVEAEEKSLEAAKKPRTSS